jgi:hypothetical protein
MTWPHGLLLGGRKLPAWGQVLYGIVWGVAYYCLIGMLLFGVLFVAIGPDVARGFYGEVDVVGALFMWAVGWPLWVFAYMAGGLNL